jgi:hypothetical protein
MHEGASGGGKSEMLQHIVREPNGQVMIGRNTITGETRLINLPIFSSFNPVTDDMALCHPSFQGNNGKLRVMDAEKLVYSCGWCNRVWRRSVPRKIYTQATPHRFIPESEIASRFNGAYLGSYRRCTGKPFPNPRVILPVKLFRM